jgi:hypothetical protein
MQEKNLRIFAGWLPITAKRRHAVRIHKIAMIIGPPVPHLFEDGSHRKPMLTAPLEKESSNSTHGVEILKESDETQIIEALAAFALEFAAL